MGFLLNPVAIRQQDFFLTKTGGRYKMNANTNGNSGNNVRVVTFLDREQLDYLDKLGKDACFEHGHKLSRVKILAALVDLMRKTGVRAEDLDLEHMSLSEAIFEVMNSSHGKVA